MPNRSGPFCTNPMGNVLGAFLAAMLYDTVGPALLATLDADEFQSTLDLDVRFAHLEASLSDSDDTTLAVATATARVIPLASAQTAV